MSHLVSPRELASILGDRGLRVCDVRWYLGEPERGASEYRSGHVPGAVFVDLETDLCGDGGGGRHPLPTPTAFARALGRLGIEPSIRVVAYDASGGSVAARLWWMLRSIGHERAQVLDGGLPAWVSEGLPLTDQVPTVPETRYPDPGPWRGVVAGDEVAQRLGTVPVVDARAPERYRGEVEPVDPRAGHVPGAVNLPHTGNLGPDGRLLDRRSLARRYAGVAGEETIVYCGSGVTACHDILAMVEAGLTPPLLYAGSWSDWSSSPGRPVAIGPEPGRA